MKCCQAKSFGKAAAVLHVCADADKPHRKQGELLVKVLACGLTPGDVRMLSGEADLMRKPPNGFPYVPAGDVCGVVCECDQDSPFHVGDRVLATWEMMGLGGLAEFAIVDQALTVLAPAGISPADGAALVNSGAYAYHGVANVARVKAGERVLVLGGSGGMGTFLVQLLRNAGAGFVACTSTDEPLMKSLGVDRVIDYRKENWWEAPEFTSAEGKFDLIVDCAEGKAGWQRCGSVLKSSWEGGRWMAYVLNAWEIEMHRYVDMLCLLGPPLLRGFGLCSPKYKMMLGGKDKAAIAGVCELFAEGKVRVALHGGEGLPFTPEGVVGAFETMEQRKGHGNVVVLVGGEA